MLLLTIKFLLRNSSHRRPNQAPSTDKIDSNRVLQTLQSLTLHFRHSSTSNSRDRGVLGQIVLKQAVFQTSDNNAKIKHLLNKIYSSLPFLR